MLAGAALTAAPPTAQAAAKKQVVNVPCSGPALAAAIAAVTTPTILRLHTFCNYDIFSELAIAATDNITIIGGPSTAIRRASSAGPIRLFNVAANGTLRIAGIFLLNGNPLGDGGAILNAGSLSLDHVTVSGNVAGVFVAGGNGGGLANSGTAFIRHSVFSENTATVATTTANGNGGAISNTGGLTIFNTRLSANRAIGNAGVNTTGDGGGVATTGGTSDIIQTTIDHNNATNQGGGVFTITPGATSIRRTRIESNSATDGGGIYGPRTITFSIVRNNTPNQCANLSTPCGIP